MNLMEKMNSQEPVAKPGKSMSKGWSFKLLTPLLVFILLVPIAGAFRRCEEKQSRAAFRTSAIKRGDLLITVSATGTVEPEQVIDVGAQVAGQITSFGKDQDGKTVDFGSVVRKGMVLAKIDQSLYAAELDAALSELESGKANLQQCEADRAVMLAKVGQTEKDWLRAQDIGPSGALARARYDQYHAEYQIAKANLSVSEAAIVQAKAGISRAKAAVRRAERNIGYCTITSPVDGIVIDRRVNIGQTVVASLNAPSLFLLAKNLKRMQIWAAVNEADVCSIHPGHRAVLTVDALPGETFSGKVGKIRLNASMTQNVVVYTVEVDIDNSRGRLLPYLTANVTFQIDKRVNVLLVPNAAFHWQPPRELIDPAGSMAESDPAYAGTERKNSIVWVPIGRNVRPVAVRTGLSDGWMTEIVGDSLKEGRQVIVGLQHDIRKKPKGKHDPANPFMPNLPQPPAGRGGGKRR
jgi:HlyD family secretion protein